MTCMRDHRARWVVLHRRARSLVLCTECHRRWLTTAAYVGELPDQSYARWRAYVRRHSA